MTIIRSTNYVFTNYELRIYDFPTVDVYLLKINNEQVMYRRPKFLEVLIEIRQEMSREADYDVDLFAEMIRSGKFSNGGNGHNLTDSKTETESESETEI